MHKFASVFNCKLQLPWKYCHMGLTLCTPHVLHGEKSSEVNTLESSLWMFTQASPIPIRARVRTEIASHQLLLKITS